MFISIGAEIVIAQVYYLHIRKILRILRNVDKGYLPKPAVNTLIGETLGVLYLRLRTKKECLLLLLLLIILVKILTNSVIRKRAIKDW